MATDSLLQGCQELIEKGQVSWKSYFSKWETVAKYEEDLPESKLFDEPEIKVKPVKNRRTVKAHIKKSSFTKTKNYKSKRKIIKKKNPPQKCTTEKRNVEQCEDTCNENTAEFVDEMTLESLLRTAFKDILKKNQNGFQAFSLLSHTFSNGRMINYSQTIHCPMMLPSCNNRRFIKSVPHYYQSFCPPPTTYNYNFNNGGNLFESAKSHPHAGEWEKIRNLPRGFPNIVLRHSLREQQVLLSMKNTSNQSLDINIGVRNYISPFCNMGQKLKKLESLKWNWIPEIPNSVCEKVNDCFVKSHFDKKNLTLDRKRFRNLCLHNRTNSVAFNMENSSFLTPERKPPERKCFSENVLQRKRRHPSKLFFDDEEEDSESDDLNETRAPLIHSKNKKLKPEVSLEIAESDSDDCESVFDRVKKS